jgi:hypothetical protein
MCCIFGDGKVFTMKIYPYIKSAVIAVSLTVWGLNAQTLIDFIGDWTGVENLQSPTTSYESKSISIQISQGGDRENYLIYTSSSDFIYDQNLNWAYHYVGIDKLTNQLIFLRRWITPIGTIGFEEFIYDIVEWNYDTFTAEYQSENGETHHEIIVTMSSLKLDEILPDKISLIQNFPNPFNPSTTISVELDKGTNGTLVIYNVNGQVIITLHNGYINSGLTSFQWDGNDQAGLSVSGGTYIYRLLIDGYTQSQKMVLLK